MIEVGQVVGEYRILKKLGEGGMGMVFLGQHSVLSQRVAIKALQPSLFNNERAKERFIREAEVLSRLNHPNLIRLLNFHALAEGCFIVMEFVEGETLEDKLLRHDRIAPPTLVPWFVQILSGLGYAHKQGIVHRDMKPSNVMIAKDGTVKILDFGTAKLKEGKQLTAQGMTLGTLLYMPKEQIVGKEPDGRSDIYSLGVTLYEALTGDVPFYDEDQRKLLGMIVKQDPPKPSHWCPKIPTLLEDVVLKAMAREREGRFQTAEDFAEALKLAAKDLPDEVLASSAPEVNPFKTTAIELLDENPAG